jgi:hypothetical protein
VRKPAASDSRNRTVAAISAGVATRASGCGSAISRSIRGASGEVAISSV